VPSILEGDGTWTEHDGFGAGELTSVAGELVTSHDAEDLAAARKAVTRAASGHDDHALHHVVVFVLDDVAVVHVLLRLDELACAVEGGAGSENLARTTVTCPGFALTVSFSPASSGPGSISPDFRNGRSVETSSCGTPFAVPYFAA